MGSEMCIRDRYMMEILDADEAKKRAVLETAITKMTERE